MRDRYNTTLKKETKKQLREIAFKEEKNQNEVIEELVEEKHKELNKGE